MVFWLFSKPLAEHISQTEASASSARHRIRLCAIKMQPAQQGTSPMVICRIQYIGHQQPLKRLKQRTQTNSWVTQKIKKLKQRTQTNHSWLPKDLKNKARNPNKFLGYTEIGNQQQHCKWDQWGMKVTIPSVYQSFQQRQRDVDEW